MEKIKNKFSILTISLGILLMLGGTAYADLDSGLVAYYPSGIFIGTFSGSVSDVISGKQGHLTIAITSDAKVGSSHDIGGTVTLTGFSSCFTQGSFEGFIMELYYKGWIMAKGAGFSEAFVSIKVSTDLTQILIVANSSLFKDPGGEACVILGSAILTKQGGTTTTTTTTSTTTSTTTTSTSTSATTTTTLPTIPTEPILTLTTSGTSVTASWSSVANAIGYTLFYAPYPYTGPDSIGSVEMGTKTGASFNLWGGAAFYVAVQAYNGFGNSGYSNIEYFIIGSPPPTYTWKAHANIPTGGYWGATAVWNNMLYVIGGGGRYSSIEAYDPISDSWVIKNDYHGGYLVRAITVDNVIYVLGDDGEFWKYTPSSDTWETLPDAPTPKWVSELAEVNGNIYAFGGYGPLNSVWEYNPASGVWRSKAPMPTARYGSATAIIDNKIYVFGGNYGTSSNEVYDPSTNSWEIKSDLPLNLWGWDVAGPSGNKIVVVEAEDPGSTVIYDPITDSYAWGDEITTSRDGYTMGDSINDSIFVAGGYADEAQNKLESYKPPKVLKTVLRKPEAASSAAMMDAYMQKHKKMEDALLQAMEK